MTWLKLDDAFADHPKIAGLSDEAFRLHVEALCYCARQLTDGIVPSAIVVRMGGDRPDELVDAGLWLECAEGYAVRDFLDYNPSREKVLAEREANRTRQKRWRDGRSNGVTNGTSNAKRTGAPTRPDPTTKSSPVDNSRPRLRAVNEISEADREDDGPVVPSSSPAVQEHLRQARQRKGET